MLCTPRRVGNDTLAFAANIVAPRAHVSSIGVSLSRRVSVDALFPRHRRIDRKEAIFRAIFKDLGVTRFVEFFIWNFDFRAR